MKYNTPSSILLTLLSSFSFSGMAAGNMRLSFEGLTLPAISVEVPANTGLDMLYVCYDTANSTVKFPTSNSQTKWYRYSNLGGAYAEEITQGVDYSDGFSTLKDPVADMGYIIEDGDNRSYFWIVGYKGKRLTLRSARASEEQDCDASIIDVDGEGAPLHYFTINGQQRVLSREIEVTYQTLTFDNQNMQYIQGETKQVFESLTDQLRIIPPAYCQTEFIISGDRFLREWDWLSEVSTEIVQPHAVEIHTVAYQEGTDDSDSDNDTGMQSKKRKKVAKNVFLKTNHKSKSLTKADEGGNEDDPIETPENGHESSDEEPGSNIITGGITGLGGSAPAVIHFEAFVTDGVLHNEWQMSTNPDFDPIDYRFTQQDLDYTFNEEGTFYVRFVGSNSDGSCEAYGEDYKVTIGASELKIPNAFSPNGDGINDEWKVAYRSLTKFECWIFDRYGNEICHLTDPSMGWDGKIGGKEAKPGVYYYVIEALGADGKKYKKSGDINILRYVGGMKTETVE